MLKAFLQHSAVIMCWVPTPSMYVLFPKPQGYTEVSFPNPKDTHVAFHNLQVTVSFLNSQNAMCHFPTPGILTEEGWK